MAFSTIENINRATTRRDFLKGCLLVSGMSLYGANKLIPRLIELITLSGAHQEYPRETILLFDQMAKKVTDWFAARAQALGVKPPAASFETHNFLKEQKSDSIIHSLSPNTFMIFTPGGNAEELGEWVEEFLNPWITAFNCLRTGRPKLQILKETESYIKSLNIDHLMGASPPLRRQNHFMTMIPTHTPIFPWEFVTGGRLKDGQAPPEHPEAMSIFVAGYMRWILRENPTAEFVLWGHSLGASSVHCLLRLIQGGVFKDLSVHIPHAILYSQAFNDVTNEVAFRLATATGNRHATPESLSWFSLGQGKEIPNKLALVLNAACSPTYFSGLNPEILREREITTTSVYSADDPASCGVPGANAVILRYPSSKPESIPLVTRGIVPSPDQFISLPINIPGIFNTLDSYTHKPSHWAINSIFGVADY